MGRFVARAHEQIEAFFARMIRKGKDEAEIPAHVNAEEVARGLLTSLSGLVVLTRSRLQHALLRNIVDDALGRLGFVPNPYAVMAEAPALLKPVSDDVRSVKTTVTQRGSRSQAPPGVRPRMLPRSVYCQAL